MVLDRIRVLDLSRAWAGTMAARILADIGAEVIHIEAPQGRGGDKEYFDKLREMQKEGVRMPNFPNSDLGEKPWNRLGTFNDFNRNKLGVTLDLRHPRGQDIFKRLVKISDVVLENYTPRVMENFGLDYPVIRNINPSIIMISMPGYGMTGPYRDYPAYGTSLEQHAGLSSVMGYPNSGPYRTQSTYPDPVAAVNAASAVMLALWYRRHTGKGQYIELAQIEAVTCLIGEVILDYSMNKRCPIRSGNRHTYMAPHGAYRCRGEDAWVAIAVANDKEWRAFCGVIGNPPWTKDERFVDQLSRWQNQDEMDRLIEGWTVRCDHYEVMHALQRAGIAAGAVLNAEELLNDPQLKERDYFVEITHPQAGSHPYPRFPIKLSGISTSCRRPAPCLGEHNEYVLGQLLGLPKDEIAQLAADKVISDDPVWI